MNTSPHDDFFKSGGGTLAQTLRCVLTSVWSSVHVTVIELDPQVLLMASKVDFFSFLSLFLL